MPLVTAAERDETPSARPIADTWIRTMKGDIDKITAISLFVLPADVGARLS